MGCTASRENSAFAERDKERFGSRRRLGKSSSFTALRASKPRDLHYDYHVVALTSSTYGLMKLLESESVNEHLASVIGGKGSEAGKESDANGADEKGAVVAKFRKSDSMPPVRDNVRTWTDMAMASSYGTVSRFKLEQERRAKIEAKFPLNPKIPEEAPATPPATPPSTTTTETINTWELMEGLDDQPSTPPSTTTINSTTVEAKPVALGRSRSLSAVDGLRVATKPPVPVDSTSSVTQVSTNNAYSHSTRGSMDFSSRGSMDFSSTGFPLEFSQRMSGELRLPPVDYHCHSGPLSSAMEFAQRYSGPLSNAGLPSGQVIGIPVGQQFQPVFPNLSDNCSSHLEEDTNLFDPDILATFQDLVAEERTTTSSDDDWCHIRTSDGEASTSGSTADDDSPWAMSSKGTSANICDCSREDSQSGTYGPRRMSFAKVMPLEDAARFRAILDPLTKYEARCPPGGDHRVVLYLTSLRGIRKTFEDCHSLRMIFQSFPVWVDERDVSMHAEFRRELKELLDGGPVIVPRVFINGRYIGGSDEVRRLHEDGKLGELLHDLPVVHVRKPCDGCGGVRFVPCPECSGSCKIITDANEVARCEDCNENGLIRCPVCF